MRLVEPLTDELELDELDELDAMRSECRAIVAVEDEPETDEV